MERISRYEMLMRMAKTAALRSTCERRQVGAIIAKDGRPLSMGYGGAPPGLRHCTEVGCLIGPDGGCLRTTHAESNAIAFAARNGVETANAVIYTTVSPCMVCAKLLLAAGIHDIIYDEEYRNLDPIYLLEEAGARVYQLKEGSLSRSVLDAPQS